ncbi:MAG: hypothetical protein AAFO62_01110 [Pseudomonadota bacterium]
MSRLQFAAQVAVGLALPVGTFFGSFYLLPSLAEILAPRGINAGTAQNALIVGAGLIAAWVLLAAGIRRLRSIREPIVFAAIAVVPAAAILLLDGPVFLRPILALPDLARDAVYFVSAGVGVWIICSGLMRSAA